ncbi:Serine/threonine-protein kinase PknB [Stieleria neptunia]|uniref:Serine/threonine-protein kinase PknB n=1 Tax=Stieleria neptunia TaxID=2527979 RepID=A0A518I2X6_9BACT|nr:protein kinase [Stieleria neptunia]QDV47461.1 Serine/threonine-protein kinase PknB [Stieleria neptunia]
MTFDAVNRCVECGQEILSTVAGNQCAHCLLKLVAGAESSTGSILSGHDGLEFLKQGVLPRFDDYELVDEIARGGMGVVYLAEQLSLRRPVAIKMILAGQLATEESIQRFRNEAEAAAKLDHPGIVPIYEVGEFQGQHFFSMKLIDGASLSERLGEFALTAAMSEAEARRRQSVIASLIEKIARTLAFAHERGVLHRDVKPGNILVDRDGAPHLTDFGLAKLTGREASGLTLSSAVLGSPSYMAPEQAVGSLDQVTTSADVYGVGAVLYELLTGQPPFVGTTALETMQQVIKRPPVRPSQFGHNIHPDLETITLKCLEKQPERRYAGAAAVADELERFMRGEPIRARPIGRSEYAWRWMQRNPVVAVMTMSLLLAIVIGSVSALWQWRRAETANVDLTISIEQLQWREIAAMLQAGESARALAKVASLIREDETDWKAAMFGMSIMQQHRFPLPVSTPIRHPHGAELRAARLSPDGRRIVTTSYDATARLWDSRTSKQVLPALQHEGVVNWASFRPDGQTLATCSDDKTVRFWNINTGQPEGQPIVHDERVLRVHFNRDGRYLLTRTNHFVSIFNADDQRRLVGPLKHKGQVVAARFLPDGETFFTAQRAGQDSLVQAWDIASGKQRLRLATSPLVAADLSAGLERVATVTAGRLASIWDATTGKQLHEITTGNGEMTDVLFSPDGESVAAVGRNHWARILNTTTGLPVTPELSHSYLVNGVAFSARGDRVLTWADDSLAQLWDATSGSKLCEPIRHTHRVKHAELGTLSDHDVILTTLSHTKMRPGESGTGAAMLWWIHDRVKPISRHVGVEPSTYDGGRLSRDAARIVIGKTTEEAWVIDTATGHPVCGPLKVNGGAWGLLFSPDSERVITTTSRGQVCVWDVASGKLVDAPVQLDTMIQPAEITTDGRHFATGSTDGFARLWDAATGRVVHAMKHGSEINALDFSPDGARLASAGEDRITRLWDTETGTCEIELKGHGNEVMAVSFAPDGRRVVTASQDFTARIWDATSGHEIARLSHQGEVIDAIFSPDGRYIATASRDRTAVIWDAETGRAHSGSLMHKQAVRNVRFSPDSQRLLTLDFRGLQLWDVATGHPLTVHLPQILQGGIGFQSNTGGPGFTPDGNMVFLACDSPESLLWHVPVPPPNIPAWFPAFLEAVAGLRFEQGTNITATVPPTSFLMMRDRLANSSEVDDYTTWAQEWLKNAPDLEFGH